MVTVQACPPSQNTTPIAGSSSFVSTIPVVDLSKFENTATRKKFLLDLEDALDKWSGFIGVINSDVDDELLEKGYKTIHDFFASPSEQKDAINGKIQHNQRGYIPGEIALGERVPDSKEFLHIGSNSCLSNYTNIWPKHMDLEGPAMALHSELMKATRPLFKAISLLLGQKEDFLSTIVEHADNIMRCIRYTPNPKNGIWAAAHTDLNYITILPRASAKGLEVERDGQWIPVVVPKNAFIVNVADLLEIHSNGKWKSCNHRVVSTEPNTERESIVLFVTTTDETVIKPLGIGESRYPEVTRRDFLMLRIFSLGYLKGMKKEIDEVINGVFIKKVKEMIDTGKAAESVHRWYAGFRNTVAHITAEDKEASKHSSKIAAAASRVASVLKKIFSFNKT